MSEQQPEPRVVYGSETPTHPVDTESIAQTMHELGISDQTINETTVYVDPKKPTFELRNTLS